LQPQHREHILAVLLHQENPLGERALTETVSGGPAAVEEHMTYGYVMHTIRENVGATRTEAKLEALHWLAGQLRWERTLEALRGRARRPEARAA
jgi:hypothetical protein